MEVKVERFEDLWIWQEARVLVRQVYSDFRQGPGSRDFGFRNQIQKAAVSVMNNITARKAAIASGEYEICLGGDSVITDKIGPFEFEISANSFFQTNTRGAGKLYETVKLYADLSGDETIVDLYSGTGTIPIFLSRFAKEIIGKQRGMSAAPMI